MWTPSEQLPQSSPPPGSPGAAGGLGGSHPLVVGATVDLFFLQHVRENGVFLMAERLGPSIRP